MRDPNRIPIVLKALEELWNKHPDMRLGQLIGNLSWEVQDLFYIDDGEWLRRINKVKETGDFNPGKDL